MNKTAIFILEWKIKNLAGSQNTTIENCLAQYESRKKNANGEAILGVAWHCLIRAKEANNGELYILPQHKNISTDQELFLFYFSSANRAFGMADIEFIRTKTLRKNQENTVKEMSNRRIQWDELVNDIDPKGKRSNSDIADKIAKRLALPKKAEQTIRKNILPQKIRNNQK
ncbi:MAG: hypothetical protein WC785_01035 [Tatlockia sp.]